MKISVQIQFTCIAIFLSTASLAGTCSQTQNEIVGLVGLDSQTGTVYSSTVSSTNSCNCAHVRFKPENTDVDKALSILLAAKLSSTKVRVDLLSEGDCNSAYRVYLH